jgi:hypothetical protein
MNDQLQVYNKPLFVRKTKPVAKDEFAKDHKNFAKERYTEIKEGGKNIHNMVKDYRIIKCCEYQMHRMIGRLVLISSIMWW